MVIASLVGEELQMFWQRKCGLVYGMIFLLDHFMLRSYATVSVRT
jgi:hypothetical protein